MNKIKMEKTEIIDRIIVGRVDPYIYAFETNTIPNYLKIGDTYRPVNVRLEEWRKQFPDLVKRFEKKAIISDEVYFRDYSVHRYLETDLKKKRLLKTEIDENTYYSKEFFKETNSKHLLEAIRDINDNFIKGLAKYDYYYISNHMPTTYHYKRQNNWILRPNQKEAVDHFVTAVKNGRTNLLMYAVMRFGKSFTSLYCALEINAKLTLVLSAKADVKEEWKKTVESAGNFENFVFLEGNDLLRDENIIKNSLNSNQVVLFLTLQDLQGSEIKNKHKELFQQDIDLLIVDETHFGARAKSYGAVLKAEVANIKKLEDERIDQEDVLKEIKIINAKVKLHLSGTPYRILMGNEFEKEDIISFVQFSDIVAEQEAWDNENLFKDDINEWDNPYFGFPQMVRFAFNVNESSIRKMNILKKSGVRFTLSALFEPVSIKRDNKDFNHEKFKNENEILDLLQIIDGSKMDANLLGFLDYEKIKDGFMCRHIVMVLPYCASCDAMEKLIKNNLSIFKNLNEYEILNISGVTGGQNYKNPNDVKNIIEFHEKNSKKTITLTVNRMLTGSTVEQWDTMLYFKDTSSPQEYDQAIFRLQNQYIRTFSSGKDSIKKNMKPQTLLVDFDIDRLFRMQEQKSLIYNVNTEKNGNHKLLERINEELRISPIITMNNGKIKQVEAVNIMDAISNYNKNRSISQEVTEIPIDLSILDNDLIRSEIEKQSKFNSKGGLSIKPIKGDGEELEFPENDGEEQDPSGLDDNNKVFKGEKNNNIKELENKIQTYYQRILFYSFLTKESVNSLEDIINSFNSLENIRLRKNLYLDSQVLQKLAKTMDPFKKSSLDYKIQNISKLAEDESLTPIERALTSLKKFSRMSESEIITPSKVCEDIVNLIPKEGIKKILEEGETILDISSKSGEFAVALYKRFVNDLGYAPSEIKNKIYSIPTSSIAYEFTRKFYEILDLEVENIATNFNSYDLLSIRSNNGILNYNKIAGILKQKIKFNEINLSSEIFEGDVSVKFGAIVGNPPYQQSDGGAAASAKPIYHEFVLLAKALQPNYISFITPTRWFAGGKGLNEFRDKMLSDNTIVELHDILTPEDIFPDTNNRGGVCYYLMNADKKDANVRIVTHQNNQIIDDQIRPMKQEGIDIFVRDSTGVKIVEKIFKGNNMKSLTDIISPRRPFGLDGSFVNSNNFHKTNKGMTSPVKCYGKAKRIGYLEENKITQNKQWIDSWKVFIPYANNIGTELNDDNQNSFVGEPLSVSTETFLVVGADLNLTKESAQWLSIYLRTKFARFLHGLSKVSQHGTRQTYRFVPLLNFTDKSTIDWSKPIDQIDEQLFIKYNLNLKEIEHIKNSIKVMD